jgi:hypothetical protein
MFRPDDIQVRIRERQFVPLRIVTSAGEKFDIHHPDLIMIGRSAIMIGTASTENPAHFEQVNRVAIMDVTALEDLPIPAPPTGNGQQ